VATFIEGKQQHTTYSRHFTPSEVTVTRRHHPLLGRRLEVAFGGSSSIVVRIADGITMRIPRAWTDADGAPPHEPAETVFSIEALRDLLRLLDAIDARAHENVMPLKLNYFKNKRGPTPMSPQKSRPQTETGSGQQTN
jgi:hypothetical protein